ncbi:MAG TPA: DinB family protein [Longimicrobiales bacterium]
MTTDEVKGLFAYNRWANDRVLRAAGTLSPEQFTRDLGSSYPSIAATLAHILGAEWVWLSRWNGISPTALPADWELGTLEDLGRRWQAVEAEQTRFIDALDDPRLAAPITYRNFAGDTFRVPLATLLRHLVNHSTYHRGQVTTMLRQLGAATVATDLVLHHNTVGPIVTAV